MNFYLTVFVLIFHACSPTSLSEDIVKDTEQSWVNLKSREQKKSVHPMIAALQNK
eukprot:m.43706 g.43706  ORF g.43706 m.43706 type:complete len:55 (+) comp7123_c1_seq4:2066-2230(+)